MEQSKSDASSGEQSERQKKKQTVPHLINLNEDPQLSRVIIHFLETGNMLPYFLEVINLYKFLKPGFLFL